MDYWILTNSVKWADEKKNDFKDNRFGSIVAVQFKLFISFDTISDQSLVTEFQSKQFEKKKKIRFRFRRSLRKFRLRFFFPFMIFFFFSEFCSFTSVVKRSYNLWWKKITRANETISNQTAIRLSGEWLTERKMYIVVPLRRVYVLLPYGICCDARPHVILKCTLVQLRTPCNGICSCKHTVCAISFTLTGNVRWQLSSSAVVVWVFNVCTWNLPECPLLTAYTRYVCLRDAIPTANSTTENDKKYEDLKEKQKKNARKKRAWISRQQT